jgi:hypothetical protein
MKRLAKAAPLTKLVQALRKNNSWAGETHIQQATYLLQNMLGVPFGFQFILYWHGPFSFDVRDELAAFQADDLFILEPQGKYGPRYAPSELAEKIQKLYPRTLGKYSKQIEFITGKFKDSDVARLEKLATAYYVTEDLGLEAPVTPRQDNLVRLKPHIPPEEAKEAILEIDQMIIEAQVFNH